MIVIPSSRGILAAAPPPVPPTNLCGIVINKYNLIYQPGGIPDPAPIFGTPPSYDIVYKSADNFIMYGHWNVAGTWIFYPASQPSSYFYKNSTQPYTVPTGAYTVWSPGVPLTCTVTEGICP